MPIILSFGILIYFLLCPPLTQAEIKINELLASTEAEDQHDTSLEWIELYNNGDSAVSLSGYGLSDDPAIPHKWRFPTITIEPRSHLLIWATGFGVFMDGAYHANFQLNRDGETLSLSDANGNTVDRIAFPPVPRDVSYGRLQDGRGEWGLFDKPTPGEPNTGGLLGPLAPPQFLNQAVVSGGPVEVRLRAAGEGQIVYTADGSPPTAERAPYTGPLRIEQTTVIRARSLREGYRPSAVVTQTFVIQEQQPLPIMTITTDPPNLWDRRSGIYANASNRGRAWERPCTVEFFAKDGQRQFVEEAGVRMHGGASRERSPKKSFRLYFRSVYGKPRLDYPLFPTSTLQQHNQLTIRAGFNDQWGYDNNSQRPTAIFVSDQVVRDLHRDMGQLAVHGIWVELYVNGEYFGLYNPTERIEDDIFFQRFGHTEWDVIKDEEVRDGSRDAWQALSRWAQRNDLSRPSVYQEFTERVDMENFVSYMLINIYMQNYDWPQQNWYSFRARHPFAQWRFLLWDIEYSFGSGNLGYRIDQPTFETAQERGNIGVLFRSALRSNEFRQRFWRRIHQAMDGALSRENIMKRLDQHLAIVRPVIPKEAVRWGFERKGGELKPMTLADWEAAVDLAKQFVEQRPRIFLRMAEETLGAPPVGVEEWRLFDSQFK